ncbi:MAG TPA: hypothetical protein VL242_36045 [Sorangium sp.]|nr:hypothetical protein [Sorangium sp.]
MLGVIEEGYVRVLHRRLSEIAGEELAQPPGVRRPEAVLRELLIEQIIVPIEDREHPRVEGRMALRGLSSASLAH